ncbi:PAS domain S-box-containing protein [Zobellia uliginosa]|uniref:PAS domain S-box-containing protein n=1 Tax=Zobellia uliginosa TaxID=143224 RepID=A0ABY1KIJ7_9FLAO|nr:PAS domain-containing protein [Zobellia uliginosa]SIS39034.1 PAS domain S-box-containing protein [Zobellia uliginosa]
MKVYDKAAKKYYGSLDITPLPLLSWDVHAAHVRVLCETGNTMVDLRQFAEMNRWAYSKLNDLVLGEDEVVVITDPKLSIVHTTSNINTMTGYRPDEIIGETPKMFQGEETDKQVLLKIRTAIEGKKPFEAVVLNYRKDGSTYLCQIQAEPVFDKAGQLVNFIAYEREVA